MMHPRRNFWTAISRWAFPAGSKITLLLTLVFLCPLPLHANNFTIDLKAQSGKEAKTAEANYPPTGSKPRTILSVGADATIKVKWLVRHTELDATAKDVLVHFFVVKIDKPDQQEVPKLTKNVIVESALNMDFRPKDKTEGDLVFTIPHPGVYLLRLELKGAAAGDEPEPVAAIDVMVK